MSGSHSCVRTSGLSSPGNMCTCIQYINVRIKLLYSVFFPKVILTVGVSWRLFKLVPRVKGPDSTFLRFSFTSISLSSTSTRRRSASRHASSFCFRHASSEARSPGSETHHGQNSVSMSAWYCNRACKSKLKYKLKDGANKQKHKMLVSRNGLQPWSSGPTVLYVFHCCNTAD